MDIVHAAEMPWGESLVAQRGGGDVAHKRLFEGEEGSPDHYMLVMAREPKSFFSPRHRHPWDQIRDCLEGKIPIAKGVFVEGGEIAYFPESVRYGPQEGGEDRIVVLLQFGGASGQGFIGADRVKQARLELAKEGRFEGGESIHAMFRKGAKTTMRTKQSGFRSWEGNCRTRCRCTRRPSSCGRRPCPGCRPLKPGFQPSPLASFRTGDCR
jgi:hypothetical protein